MSDGHGQRCSRTGQPRPACRRHGLRRLRLHPARKSWPPRWGRWLSDWPGAKKSGTGAGCTG